MEMPVHIQTAKTHVTISGETTNISRGGALIVCQSAGLHTNVLQEGDSVTVDVALPARTAVPRRCFHGVARVVRVEVLLGGGCVVAVRFRRLSITPWQETGFTGSLPSRVM